LRISAARMVPMRKDSSYWSRFDFLVTSIWLMLPEVPLVYTVTISFPLTFAKREETIPGKSAEKRLPPTTAGCRAKLAKRAMGSDSSDSIYTTETSGSTGPVALSTLGFIRPGFVRKPPSFMRNRRLKLTEYSFEDPTDTRTG